MPEINNTSSRIISFLSELHGLDDFSVSTGNAVIDLRSGMIIHPSDNYPDGEMLSLEYAPGALLFGKPGRVDVYTYKLVNLYLLHHAEVEAIMNGGKVKYYYDHISNHFSYKTSFQL